MWLLQGNGEIAGKVHYLVCGQTLVVGRRNVDILLSDDASVSRKHAAFTLTHSLANLKTKKAAKVELKDLDSKYGTYVNDGIEDSRRLSSEVAQELHHGDLVRFGMFYNTWRLEHQDLTVTTSTLRSEGRQELVNTLLILGGHFQNDWSSECCYLVMPSISLTVKVVCALAAGRSIVVPEFFIKLADAIIKKTPHPNPAEYLPPLQDLQLSSADASFSPDQRRSSVFAGLTFLFPTHAQLTKMCKPVQLAGGEAEQLTENNYQEVVSSKCLLISLPTESQQADILYSRTCDLLKQHGLRSVPESEIGLAVLFVSIEGNCNSSFRHSDIFRRASVASQPSEELKIFATETQATEFSVSLTGSKVVPESGVPQPSTSAQGERTAPRASLKRPLVTNSDDDGGAKRSNRAPPPGPTQPLSAQELCDEDEAESGKTKKVDVTSFKPEHTSTQREDSPPSTTIDQSATVSFAPYTLPSLKTLEPEEEEKTQPFHRNQPQEDLLGEEERAIKVKKEDPKVKKEDPQVKLNQEKELKFDEWWKMKKEDSGSKRARSEETSFQHQENKKINTRAPDDKNSPFNKNSQDNRNGSSGKRKLRDGDEDSFALPPRRRQRERTVENLTSKQTADSDLFALPAELPHTRRLPTHQAPVLVPPTFPSPTQDTAAIPLTSELPPVARPKKEAITSSKFFDREGGASSSSSLEVTVCRTLVMVEPMVKPYGTPHIKPSKSDDSTCLLNFKVFKKINAACILKVIGGSDLMVSDQTARSQEFKIDIHVSKSKQLLEDKRHPSFDEELFDMTDPIRKRR